MDHRTSWRPYAVFGPCTDLSSRGCAGQLVSSALYESPRGNHQNSPLVGMGAVMDPRSYTEADTRDVARLVIRTLSWHDPASAARCALDFRSKAHTTRAPPRLICLRHEVGIQLGKEDRQGE